MTFAVLISNYNHGNFLSDTFSSLLATSEIDKVYITDDGSHDDSVKIIRQWSDTFEKFIFLDSELGNLGYSERINLYFHYLRRFDFGMLLDSDDRLIPHGITFALRRMQKDRLNALFGATELINEFGTPTGLIDGINTPQIPYPSVIASCCLNQDLISGCNGFLNTLLTQNWVRSSSNILFKVSALDGYIPIPSVKSNPDWYAAIGLSVGGSVGYTAIPFSQHRIHSNNVTSKRIQDSRSDSIRIFEELQKKAQFRKSINSHSQVALQFNPYLK